LVLAAPAFLYAHGGADESGESLAATTGPVSGAPIVMPVETQILAGVQTAVIKKEKLPETLRVLGRTRLRPEFEAVMASPVEGRLVGTEEYTQPALGQKVTKGQIIAVVDQSISAPEAIALSSEGARVRSEILQAKAALDLAQKESDRVAKLKDVVPGKEIAQAESALTVAREKYEGLMKQGTIYERAADKPGPEPGNPKRVLMRAPIDGVITQTHVTLGEYVRPEKELYHVVNLSEVLVEAEVFENDIAHVKRATEARIIVEAYPNETFTGRLVSLGTSVDPQTRNLHVLFVVPNPDGKLVAQMFADVLIETGDMTDGLTVPKSAVVNQEGQSMVYVKTSGETFVARPVNIVQRFEDRAMIAADAASPLKEGDRVVTQGTYQVRMSATKASAANTASPAPANAQVRQPASATPAGGK
jgi:cobalt-zinc-cadmium efflux system membrane fusion protein